MRIVTLVENITKRQELQAEHGLVNKAEIDVFLELSCFFHDPPGVANLISGSSAFSKTSLNITVASKLA